MTIIDEQQYSQYKHYYWGVPDSPLDWCELNYEISPFICEFYNTFSSFAISFFAFYGIYLLYIHGSDPQHIKIIKQLGIRSKLLLSNLSLAVVGVGSAFYHATLLYKNQLFDEFPMVITASLFLYCMLTMDPVKKSDSNRYRIFRFILPSLLAIYVVTVATTIFIIRNIPTILQVSFGALVVLVVGLSTIYVRQSKEKLRDSNPKKLLLLCCVSMIVAYLSWLIERKLCKDGHVIPGIQLHAVWHVLTGLASYYWLQFYICTCLEKSGFKTKIVYNWGIGSVKGFVKNLY
eukprot:gene5172-6439_t